MADRALAVPQKFAAARAQQAIGLGEAFLSADLIAERPLGHQQPALVHFHFAEIGSLPSLCLDARGLLKGPEGGDMVKYARDPTNASKCCKVGTPAPSTHALAQGNYAGCVTSSWG